MIAIDPALEHLSLVTQTFKQIILMYFKNSYYTMICIKNYGMSGMALGRNKDVYMCSRLNP